MSRLPVRETIMSACGVAILCTLGTWQIQRLHWKEDITDRLEAAYDSSSRTPVLNAGTLSALASEKEPLSYGRIEGRILRDKAILLGPRTDEGRAGYHLLLPVQPDKGPPLIVNAGWVDGMWKDTLEERLSVLPVEPVRMRGILRKPDWSSFSSRNSPANDMWFRADIAQIAKEKELDKPYPFLLYADDANPPLADVKPHEKGWLPRNKHLQYAIFWYALAACLTGVYGFYIAGKKKKAP